MGTCAPAPSPAPASALLRECEGVAYGTDDVGELLVSDKGGGDPGNKLQSCEGVLYLQGTVSRGFN